MLINVSHLNRIQDQIKLLVDAYVGELKRQIRHYILDTESPFILI